MPETRRSDHLFGCDTFERVARIPAGTVAKSHPVDAGLAQATDLQTQGDIRRAFQTPRRRWRISARSWSSRIARLSRPTMVCCVTLRFFSSETIPSTRAGDKLL